VLVLLRAWLTLTGWLYLQYSIQAHVRRWLVKRKLTAVCADSRTRMIAFNRAVTMLVERDRRYLEQLDIASV
jgi:hypothetical protein